MIYSLLPGKPSKPVMTALPGAISLAWTPGATPNSSIIFAADVSECNRMGLHVINTGSMSLSLFEIWAKFHADAPAVRVSGAANADFTTPVFPVIKSSVAASMLLAPAGEAWLVLDVTSFHSIELRALTASGTTTVSVFASLPPRGET